MDMQLSISSSLFNSFFSILSLHPSFVFTDLYERGVMQDRRLLEWSLPCAVKAA